MLWRNDQDITLARLLAAFDGVQIDVVDIAALHLQSLAARFWRVHPFAVFMRQGRVRVALL